MKIIPNLKFSFFRHVEVLESGRLVEAKKSWNSSMAAGFIQFCVASPTKNSSRHEFPREPNTFFTPSNFVFVRLFKG